MARITRTVVKTETFIFMYQVESSNVSFVGYNNNKMYVQYKNDTTYVFDNVVFSQYFAILKSESVGKAILALKIKGTKL